MLIDQPIRGQGLPYWSNLHEALAAFYWAVSGYNLSPEAARDPRIKRETEAQVREFLKTPPGQWLVEAVHGEAPSAPKTGLRGAAAPGEGATCAWHHADPDADMWEAACGAAWCFTDDGPTENEVKFCFKCGKPVEVLPEEPAPGDVGSAGGAAPERITFKPGLGLVGE
jgi:hypothetical protein